MSSLDFKVDKINLVEYPEWQKSFDPMDAVLEPVGHETPYLYDWLAKDKADDILSYGQKTKEYVSYDEAQAILAGLKNGQLEQSELLVQDVGQIAWETAVTPQDSEIEDALDAALKETAEGWGSYFDEDSLMGQVARAKNILPEHFFYGLLETSIKYERVPGWYDRYIVTDPNQSGMIRDLLRKPIESGGRGVFDWTPAININKKQLRAELGAVIAASSQGVLSRTFSALKKMMEDVIYEDRVNYGAAWQNMLKDDPKRIKMVKRELKEFLKKLEPEDA